MRDYTLITLQLIIHCSLFELSLVSLGNNTNTNLIHLDGQTSVLKS